MTHDNLLPSCNIPEMLRKFVLENRTNAMIILTADAVAEANDAFLALLGGYNRQEVIGHPPFELMTPESKEIAYKRLSMHLANNMPRDPQTYNCVRKDGSIVTIEVSAIPWSTDPAYVVGIIKDVTSREKSIEALKESERLYRTLAESMPMGVILEDTSGKKIYVNKQMSLMTGYSMQELVDSAWLIHPEDLRAREIYQEALNQGTSGQYETRIVKKNGDTIWVKITWSPVLAEDGSRQGLHSIFNDITDRKLTEEALRNSETLHRSIVENTTEMITLTLPDSSTVYVSPACKKITGYEPEELVRPSSSLYHPEDAHISANIHFKAFSGKSGTNYEYRIITKDGETKWLSQSWSPICENGEVKMVLSVTRDVTERKIQEENLRAAHEELAHAYDLQKEFLNNVTHEVRTPLTGIMGYVQILLEGAAGLLNEEQRSLLKKVLVNSETLMETVNGVLEMAKMKSGTVPHRPRVCSPRLIIERAVSAVSTEAGRKGLQIDLNFDHDGGEGIYDQNKLTAVLTNLLSNAVKFTNKGTVEVKLESNKSGARIIVADTGIGISAQDMDRIFDEFKQLDQPHKHKPSGFGIGLAIVANMIESMGATLTVSSARGIGTAFTLTVPSIDQ